MKYLRYRLNGGVERLMYGGRVVATVFYHTMGAGLLARVDFFSSKTARIINVEMACNILMKLNCQCIVFTGSEGVVIFE